MKKHKEQTNVPALRFPEFRESGEWEQDRVCNLIRTITPPVKLTSEFYGKNGKYPIVDQSQKFFCGFTNNEQGVISENLPLIVFGDHTCVLKKIDIPFVQGADGIKIIKPKKELHTSFFYQFLLFSPVVMENYKRHFSTLKEKAICFPDITTGEQQKIADCLSSLDGLITAESEQLTALKAHKTGLMQQLFPSKGETTPKLRFPEFRESGEWKEIDLGSIGKVSMCKRILKNQTSEKGDIPFYKIGTFGKQADAYINREIFNEYKSKYSYPNQGDILISASGTIGRLVVFNGQEAYFQDSNIVWIDNNEKLVSNIFLYHCYTKVKWSTDDNTISRLYNENLRKMKVFIPSPSEQQKIADCLSSLDTLITAQAEKIEQLKQHKKGLMQQLFPVMDGIGA